MEGLIGIAGGVGPFAGLALQRHILEQTIAIRDQDHVPVLAISRPGTIPDRTEFLLGRAGVNPAFPLLAQLRLLSEAGATVAGIPCNTAHAPAIFEVIRTGVARFGRPLRLLNMIDETAAFLRASHRDLRAVGVLSTTGTWRVRLYPAALEPLGYHVVVPDEALQTETIHPAIYDPDYGLKASGRVTERARAGLDAGILHLRQMGAEAIVLGCTELPMAFPTAEYEGIPLVDPALALARALIRAVDPARLKWRPA